MTTEEQELRIRCIQLAINGTDAGWHEEHMLDRAQHVYDFITQSGHFKETKEE